MRKVFTYFTIFICSVLFCSCVDDGNLFQVMFDTGSGKATATLNGNTFEYTSSVVMFDEYGSRCAAIGMASSVKVDNLINSYDIGELSFPFLAYRTPCDIKAGDVLPVNNVLTEADLEKFGQDCLLNGKFADQNIVSIAMSDTKYYIMNTGIINVTKVTKYRVKGNYSGTAYVIDLNATPKISEELVTLSGDFTSRVAPIRDWLLYMQLDTESEIGY